MYKPIEMYNEYFDQEYRDQVSELKGVDLEQALSEFIQTRQEVPRPHQESLEQTVIEPDKKFPQEQHPWADLENVIAWEKLQSKEEPREPEEDLLPGWNVP